MVIRVIRLTDSNWYLLIVTERLFGFIDNSYVGIQLNPETIVISKIKLVKIHSRIVLWAHQSKFHSIYVPTCQKIVWSNKRQNLNDGNIFSTDSLQVNISFDSVK